MGDHLSLSPGRLRLLACQPSFEAGRPQTGSRAKKLVSAEKDYQLLLMLSFCRLRDPSCCIFHRGTSSRQRHLPDEVDWRPGVTGVSLTAAYGLFRDRIFDPACCRSTGGRRGHPLGRVLKLALLDHV
jgi:hypothetical protein